MIKEEIRTIIATKVAIMLDALMGEVSSSRYSSIGTGGVFSRDESDVHRGLKHWEEQLLHSEDFDVYEKRQ